MSGRTKPNLSRKRINQIIEGIYDCDADFKEIARTLNLKISDFAQLANTEEVTRVLMLLRDLADIRSDLFTSRYRHHAVGRLHGIAAQEKSIETARKACADLLKVGAVARGDDREFPSLDEADEPIEVQRLLRCFGDESTGVKETEDD